MDTALTFPLIQKFVFIPPHGLFVAIGFLVGATLLMREVRTRDMSPEVVVNALTWGAFGSILGARADYVISHPDVFLKNIGFVESLLSIVKIWEGGLALFGGLIGGVLFSLPTLLRGRAHIPRMLDAVAPCFAIGIAVGRIGDLIIGDHLGDAVLGSPWWKPLSYTIKAGTDMAPGFGPSPAIPGDCATQGQFFAGCSYHLPALYDMVGSALIFLILIVLRRKWAYRSGQLFAAWAIMYGVQRILLDFTRSIDERPLLGMTGTQLLGVLFATIALATLLRTVRRGYGVGDSADDPSSREASMHRGAAPGDAAGGVLLEDEGGVALEDEGGVALEDEGGVALEDEDGTDPAESDASQDSGEDSEASSTPSAKPLA